MYAVGLMSGTSLDGVDAALVEITGTGLATQVRLIDFCTTDIPAKVKADIRRAVTKEHSSVDLICSLNFQLGYVLAEAVKSVCRRAGFPLAKLDYIASHGQTVWHTPRPAQGECRSTLQIGEPAVIAYETGVQVVSGFRTMDMAAGGEGAPLVPYSEYVLYGSKTLTIALQNIGGIGNVTVIPAGAAIDKVYAFDTGPGNMIIDEAMRVLYGRGYDVGGEVAASGRVNGGLAAALAAHPYVHAPLPKTTGREMFGAPFTHALLEQWRTKMPAQDFVATVTHFTAYCIGEGYRQHILARMPLHRAVIAGGGVHNATLMRFIARQLPGVEVTTQEALGYNSDAKEAVAFAVMGNETLHRRPSNVPSATGAAHSVILGNITPAPLPHD